MQNDMVSKTVSESPALRAGAKVSHNLLGQRLGRKGQETRERILTTALRLIESAPEAALTLSGVAREASVAMTTLYLYFPDLGDLILAVLTRVMDSAAAAFEDQLRTRWPDGSLKTCSLDFLRAHYQFWMRHARVLHMRNSFADAGDARFLEYRLRVSRPLLSLLVQQMDGRPEALDTPCACSATVLMVGFERIATVVTSQAFYVSISDIGITDEAVYVDMLLNAEADVMAQTIRRQRDTERHRHDDATALHSCA